MHNIKKNLVLLFDGNCNLCNRWVDFVIEHDSSAKIKLGSLQSKEGKKYLERFGYDLQKLDTVIFIESNNCYEQSTAVLRMLGHLDGPISSLKHLSLIPAFLRDFVYRFVSRNRYNWFGKRKTCRIPDTETKTRFL